MVRSRTPKITLHTEEARCILYDTSPDFEAVFYHGTKLHISKEGSIKITHSDGTLLLDSNSRSTCLSPDMQDMLEKAHKWHKYCLEEESIREKRQEIYKDILAFPLIIGRRLQYSSKVNEAKPSHYNQQSTAPSPAPQLDDYNSDTNSYSANKYQEKNDYEDYTSYKSRSNQLDANTYDLKSASTSSLTNSNLNSSNNTNQLNHSNQNMQRTRALTTYESDSTQPIMPQYSNQFNDYQSKQFQYRSNSPHYNQIEQLKNRQLNTPSPSTQLINSMVPLSLLSNPHQFNQHYHSSSSIDNVPISLPQRDINSYKIHK